NISNGFASIRDLKRSGAGTISIGNAFVTVTGSFDNGNAAQVVDGNTSTDLPELRLDGATTSGLTDLTVGVQNHGTVSLINNATLTLNALTIGQNAGSDGTVVVNLGSHIQFAGGFESYSFIGSGGKGSLQIVGDSSTIVDTGGGSVYTGLMAGSS